MSKRTTRVKSKSRSKTEPVMTRGFAQHCWSVFRRNPWTAGAAVVSMVVGLAALGTWTLLWTEIEPWWYVSHYGLRVAVDGVDGKILVLDKKWTVAGDSTNSILRDLQIEGAEGKLSTAKNNVARWQLELSKAPEGSVTKELIQRSLSEDLMTRDKLDAQIKTLNKLRGQ